MQIHKAQTPEDIAKCVRVILELRPHLEPDKVVAMVQDMLQEGYQLAFIEENGEAMSAIGYRYLQFLFCGKHFYIDDLVTLPEARGKGYGGALLDYVSEEAKKAGYGVITLDSGHHRHTAHRLYLNKGFTISSHHFTKKIN